MTCKTNVATRASGTSSALTVALLIGFALTASSTAARAGIEPVNLALGKYAFQSSTLFGADAGRAVDGNADPTWGGGSVTHTDNDAHPYWQVDLGEVRQIGRIEIVNRTDCCSERLVPFMVIVGDIFVIDSDMTAPDASMYPGITRTIVNGPVQATYVVPINRSARWVRIALVNPNPNSLNPLSLAEVRVFEAPNAALGRVPTTSSSARSGGDPSHAVDGSTDGTFNHNSVFSSNVELYPWWQVDLGVLTNIEQIDVWSANTDCCSTTNPRPPFWVSLSPTPFTDSPIAPYQSQAASYYVSSQGSPAVVLPNSGFQVRYVRITANATDALSLAEVQVWPVKRGSVGGHAKLSTTATGSDANAAIDLNLFSAPMAVSKAQTEPYLDVDLGATRYIETVRLNHNSTVFPATYRLFVSNTDMASATTVAGTLALPGASNWVTRGTETYSTTVVMRQGRFVRVMLDGQATLNVQELQVATTDGLTVSYEGRNGAVNVSNPPSRTRNLLGYYPRPNVPISFYVFRPGSGYVLLDSTTTATTPTLVTGVPGAFYQFGMRAVTLPSDTWPAGGVGGIMVQASDDAGALIPLRGLDADDSENVFWPDARLVAASPSPDDNATKPPYLGSPGLWRGTYLTDGNYVIPPQLSDFNSRYFNGTLPGLGGTGRADPPVSVSFYNAGDLGLGRKVTCVRGYLQAKTISKNGTACAVEEYAPYDGSGKLVFGDEAGALNALSTGRPYATGVIVVYDQTTSEAPDMWFGSYKEATPGATPTRTLESQLSAAGNVGLPGMCMSCHGGDGTWRSGGKLSDTWLLPFDTSRYVFPSWNPLSNQAENFRKLNAMVIAANPTPAIAEFVNGSYANNVNTPGTTQDPNFIPAGWSKTPAQIKVYNSVIKPYCRTCHSAQTSLTFAKATDAENNRALIIGDVCSTHKMPHAQQTLKKFWSSGARAQLLGFFGRHDFSSFETCKP